MERDIYRPSGQGPQREIWRPGDDDGEITTDYFDRQGAPLPMKSRWRLFQSDIGPIRPDKNEPPKNVFLDDRAAWELLASEVPRAHLGRHWPHDFTSSGNLRARRPHRGRPAIKNANGAGNEVYQSVKAGGRQQYYFTGEKGYVPIAYNIPPKMTPKRKDPTPEPPGARKLKHNQYTPRDMLVKNGAPSFAKTPVYRRPHVNRLLLKKPSPPVSQMALARSLFPKYLTLKHRRDDNTLTEHAYDDLREIAPNADEDSRDPAGTIGQKNGVTGSHEDKRREELRSKRQKASRQPFNASTSATRDDSMAEMKKKRNEEKLTRMLEELEADDLEPSPEQSQEESERWQKGRENLERWKRMYQHK